MAKYTTASTWKQRKENRELKQKKMFEDAHKYFDIMYAVQNTKRISPWKSKVYVPVLASKAWDLISRMSDVTPLFNVTIKNELELDDATGNFVMGETVIGRQRRIEAKLHQDYLCGDQPMKLKVIDPLIDAVVAGTGYAYVPWILEDKRTRGRKYDEDGVMDNTKVVTKKQKYGHNGFEGVNFFNVLVADAPDFFSAPYVIVKGRKSLVEMQKSGLYDDAALEKCDGKVHDDDFDTFNASRNRVINDSDTTDRDETVTMISYYECYERTKDGIVLAVYAEAESPETDPDDAPWVCIRKPSIPYWHDMYPIVPFYCRKKSYSPFGESLFENNRTLQSATNDLFNHYLDNWNLSIESMIMYEDGSLTNDFVIEPGGEITFTGEAPKQFKFPEPNPQQLSVVMNVLEKGVDNATFSPYAAGNPSDANDKTQGTAYGVKSITEAATTKIGFFRDNFKQSMKVVGRIWLSNLQQFADDPEEIRRRENGREVPDIVLPSDYQGEMDLDIDDDSMTPLSKQDKRDMNSQFVNEVLMVQKAAMEQYSIFKDVTDVPRFKFSEMVEDLAELYSKKDAERYLLDSVAPPEEPVDNTKEFMNFAYKDAPPFVKKQIEEKFGLQPDPLHELANQTRAANLGAELATMITTGGQDAGNGSANAGQDKQAQPAN